MVLAPFRRGYCPSLGVAAIGVAVGCATNDDARSGSGAGAGGAAIDPGGGGASAGGGAATAGGGGSAPTTGGAPAVGGSSPGAGGSLVAGGTVGAGGAPPSSGGAGSGSAGAGGTHDPDASVDPPDAGGGAAIDGGAPIPPPVPVGCITASHLAPGVHQVTCDTTIHVLTVPEECTRRACGVVVDVHGGMMSSQMEDENTDLSALGTKYGYLVIQPNALQNALLLGQRLFVADAPGAPADDTRVMNVLTAVMQAFHADEDRIHMTGFSEGGYMTWRWFCRHPDLLASVAPGAAAWKCANLANLGLTPPEIGCELTGTAVPARNIPVLYMQGTKDGLVDPACADAWVKNNALTGLKMGPGREIAGDDTFTRTRYEDPDGVPFEYVSHDYTSPSSFLGVAISGHCYPGSTDLTVTPPAQTVIPPDQLMAFGCTGTCSFTWGEEVMKFFIAHPRR